MSLTSYRAAPPRVKPVQRFSSEKHQDLLANAFARRAFDPNSFRRRLEPVGQTGHRVQAVCTNANRVWKGLCGSFLSDCDTSHRDPYHSNKPAFQLLKNDPANCP